MTYCDMTAETGVSFRTDENTDGSTDGWMDRQTAVEVEIIIQMNYNHGY